MAAFAASRRSANVESRDGGRHPVNVEPIFESTALVASRATPGADKAREATRWLSRRPSRATAARMSASERFARPRERPLGVGLRRSRESLNGQKPPFVNVCLRQFAWSFLNRFDTTVEFASRRVERNGARHFAGPLTGRRMTTASERDARQPENSGASMLPPIDLVSCLAYLNSTERICPTPTSSMR